ncbi:MBOAT family O-acyltransferase [Clostridium cagae]|uniref:MBOAT family O-acyltransferase n=1 Tax=Clostridium cagae TaxID=2080751 RepID=UPI000CF61A06|nr:MBOAT family O-acyltransferase [Clostridium cagae]
MVFSSIIFLFLFLPLVLAGYYLLKFEYRNVFLIIVSFIFYAFAKPKFIFILLASIIINYIMGLCISYAQKHLNIIFNRIFLIITVILNLGLLFYFKYMNFFISSVNGLFNTNICLMNIVLPLGISFFIFQGMSYTLDLYMGKVKVQKNFINIVLYMSFFPKLAQGPITRYRDINKQIDSRECNIDKFYNGVTRFIIGLAKKVIIADQLGYVVDQIFSKSPTENSIAIAWVGAICYTIQIYFDFSGYSDMAIGLGKMFGFEFMENFNYPYISKSLTEFWRRWHISLSTWFRDYLYIPLGGNRSGNMYFNLFIVFLVTGIWHGASWNFIIWGLWHGLFLIIEKVLKVKNLEIKSPKCIKHLYTILIVILGWVLFRAPSLEYAINYIGIMFGIVTVKNIGFTVFWYLTPKIITIIIIATIASIPLKEIFKIRYNVIKGTYLEFISKNLYLIFIFFISIMCVMTSTYNSFIYFKF